MRLRSPLPVGAGPGVRSAPQARETAPCQHAYGGRLFLSHGERNGWATRIRWRYTRARNSSISENIRKSPASRP